MVEQQTLTLYIAVRVRVPQPNKKTPRWGIFYLVFARTAQINLRICAAKHYQCFVTISENQQISQNGNGGHPHSPVCAPTTLRVCDDALASRSGTDYAKECHTKF